MNTNLSLYKFLGDKKQVDKSSATLIETITGDFRSETDVINPIIEIAPTATSTAAKILKETNYCYIDVLGRYYYVNNMRVMAGNVIQLSLTIDPLMTWKTQILNLREGIVERNEENRNSSMYLDDSEIHVYNKPHVTTYKFNYANGSLQFGYQHESFVLAVAGR